MTNEEWEAQLKQAVKKLRKAGFVTRRTPLNDALIYLFVALVVRWVWYSEMNILFALIPVAVGLITALAYEMYFNHLLTKSGIVEKFSNQQIDIGLLEKHIPVQFKSYVAAGQSLESDLKILVNNLWWFMYPPKKIHWISWVLTRATPFWLSCAIFIVKWIAIFIIMGIAFEIWWTPERYELINKWGSTFGFSLVTFIVLFVTLKDSLTSSALFRNLKAG